MIERTEVIEIGTLGRPHGRQGEIQCQMMNDYWDEAEAEFLILDIDGILVPFRTEDWRGKGADVLIFRLRGVDSEEKAARLTGKTAYMLRRDIAEDIATELTWQDLVGYTVEDETGQPVGIVAAVDESTLNTLLELEDGRLLPIHEDLIHAIDTDARRLRMVVPSGI